MVPNMTQDQLRKILEFRRIYGLRLIAMVRECDCGKLFVAESGHERLCSEKCYNNNQRQQKLNWWKTKGNQWRANRKNQTVAHHD